MLGKEKLAVFGLGVLVGGVGLKILKSEAAKKVYVKVIAQGLKSKAECDKIIEEAKASVDDMVAEAKYVNQLKTDGVAE